VDENEIVATLNDICTYIGVDVKWSRDVVLINLIKRLIGGLK